MENRIKAWHFLPKDRHIRWGTKEEVKVGQTLKVNGPVKLCTWGLHASIKPINALSYAPGPIACLVELSGEIKEDTDKLVATERTCLAMTDATDLLRNFARASALSVLHLWGAPDIVISYLITGNKELRNAARAAARDAAWDAAQSEQNAVLEEYLLEACNAI